MNLNLKKILVPTDFSEASLDAVRYAGALAKDHGAELLLLHVIPPAMPVPPFGPGPVMYLPLPDEVRKSVQASLEAMKREQLGDAPHVRLILEDGLPDAEVVTVADAEHVDMIVIGSTGHSALASMLLGSTADRVARRASCPVLLIRPRIKTATP